MESPKNSPESIKYPHVAQEMAQMVEIDQRMRQRNLVDSEFWDEEVDKKNTARMKDIITEIGWPNITKVGSDGALHAWLLVQHADLDPAFQRMCLDLMKKEPEGEVRKQDVALLEDRVSLKENGYQIYGTQFHDDNGVFTPQPIKDPELVNDRRREMGLDTLEENIARMYEKYAIKKPNK